MDSSPSCGSGSGAAAAAASSSATPTPIVMASTGAADATPTNLLDFQKSVNKKLNDMTDRQDSIQTLSMWMIHHKTDCQRIAACWLAAMKRAKVSRRLLLFYLANDVVQSCKKKNAKIYLLAFKNVLKDAVVLVRDAAIKHKIERIFHIWEERKTYINSFVDELRELLNDREKVTAHVSATNFKPKDVVESIRKVRMLETHVSMKQKQVSNLKLDVSKIEAVKQLKDRSHSHDFAKQFDDSYTKIHSYVKMLENEIDQRTKLIQLLENGQTFYEVQNDDAMVVANAYRNFGIRINNLKKRLIDYKDTLSDGTESPIPSPSAEAPSPGNTPPHEDDDDQTEEMDMDLSDSEDQESGKIIASEPYTPSASNSLTDRLAALGNVVPGIAATDPRHGSDPDVGGYSPAEQLQREKAGSEGTDHKFLFSMVAAKAQSTSVRADKSVLKNLKDFAEKVKNPPPKDWSEFNKKQVEKAKAMVAEQQALTEQLEQRRLALQQQQQQQPEQQQQQQQQQQPEQQQQQQQQEPPQQQSQEQQQQYISQTVPSYSATPLTQLASHNEQSSHSSHSQTYNQSDKTLEAEETEPDCIEMQSMSWPPRHTPPGSEQVVNTPPTNLQAPVPRLSTPVRPPTSVPRLSSPVRPPPFVQTHQRTLAPHIQVREPVSVQAPIRPANSVVTVTSAPPPPPPPPAAVVRTISNEQQQDALDLLDSIHAKTLSPVQRNVQAIKGGLSEHITIGAQPDRSMSRAPVNQGIPIQTVGANNISPVINRQNPVTRNMARPPAPPNFGGYRQFPRPPAKRPYQDYGNYPYY